MSDHSSDEKQETAAEQDPLPGGRVAASSVEMQERPPRGAEAVASQSKGGTGQLHDGHARGECTKQTPRGSQQHPRVHQDNTEEPGAVGDGERQLPGGQA